MIIYSKIIEEHFAHVEEVVIAPRNAVISLKVAKCELFTTKAKYLGHVIRPGTPEVDQTTTKALDGLREPTTETELRSFLGLCNDYRRFIPNYSRIAASLNALLRKGQPVKLERFGEAKVDAFKTLIEINVIYLETPR